MRKRRQDGELMSFIIDCFCLICILTGGHSLAVTASPGAAIRASVTPQGRLALPAGNVAGEFRSNVDYEQAY